MYYKTENNVWDFWIHVFIIYAVLLNIPAFWSLLN